MLKPQKATKKMLDGYQEKRGRGRPPKVVPSQTRGRGDNYRGIFSRIWDKLWPPLSQAQSEQDVINAFEQFAQPHTREFMPALASVVLKVLRERHFPKRRKAQANFMADSLAAYGWVSPRRSRDICRRERTREKRAHHIIRYDFKIECSCGFKGFSRDHACPKCGAEVEFGSRSIFGFGLR
jgi:hypothetical protein